MPSQWTSAPAVSFDLSDWSQIDLSGPGAKSFLHNFCTNDVNQLTAGHACEAFLCDLKGRILGHVQIVAGEDHFRLIAVPGSAGVIVPHLRKYLLGAPVEIKDQSDELGLLCLHGNGLPEILTTATGTSVDVALNQTQQVGSEGSSLLVIGTDLLGESTFLISGDRDAVAALREQIPAQFLELGARELFELLRIEAGFPHCGRDLSSQDIAQTAARTSRAISFTKGCYLGQEPIARLDAMGHTTRELRGLLIHGKNVRVNDPVLVGEHEVGTLTSVAYSPARRASLALAKIRTSQAAPGTRATVNSSTGPVDAIIYWPDIHSLAQEEE